jgi:hypothetical protein
VGTWKMTIGMRLHPTFRGTWADNNKIKLQKQIWLVTKKTQKKKNEKSWSKLLEGPHPFGKWYEQCAILWGCTPKVASMLGAMDNGIQVPYTWQTIDLAKYEQDWLEEQDPLFDLNEDFEVVNSPRRVFGPESSFEKVCKIPSVEGNQVENVNKKGLTPHLSPLHKQWTDLWTHIIAKWWHWRKLDYRWLGTTLHLPIKCI